MTKDPKNKLFLTMAMFVLILAGIGYGYRFTSNTSAKTKNDYAKLLSESEVLDLKIANTEKTNELLAEISDIKDAMPSILPPEKIQSDIVAQILDDGRSSGIFLDSISFPTSDGNDFDKSQTEPLEGVTGVNKIGININFSSDFEQMIDFIDQLEKNRRISQIETIAVSPIFSDEGSAANQLSISILLNLYVRA